MSSLIIIAGLIVFIYTCKCLQKVYARGFDVQVEASRIKTDSIYFYHTNEEDNEYTE